MRETKKIAAAAALLGIAGIGGTFAYFSQTLTATNPFDTGTYDTELVEEFKPTDGENWEPGVEVNKDVTVKNTGSLPVVVRVKFEEKWQRKNASEPFYDIDTAADKDAAVLEEGSDAANKFESVYQGDPTDGKANTFVDDSVVHKTLNPDGDWVYNPADGYYYYMHTLAGKEENQAAPETKKLLDAVKLDENADMGRYDVIREYSTDAEKSDDMNWVEFAKKGDNYVSVDEMKDLLKAEGREITFLREHTALHSDSDASYAGYSDADYTLVITAQTIQATSNAVKDEFKVEPADMTALGCDWTLVKAE